VLDDDGAWRAGTAGDGEAAGVLALSEFQHGAPRLFGGNLHQRHDDFDLAIDVVGHALSRKHGVLERRRIAPYPAPAVLRIPHIRHVAPSVPFAGFWVLGLNYQ
jgi:hypothetical protein